jgi:N-acetylmuramoyl-L-alanine amidase
VTHSSWPYRDERVTPATRKPFLLWIAPISHPHRYNRIDLSDTVTKPSNQIIKAATTLVLGIITCLPTQSQTAPQPQPQTQPQSQPQAPPQPQPRPTPRTLILLDPAHGGPDPGAHLPNNILEKDITLTLANRLRAALAPTGFAVITTRDADPATPLTTDQRADLANHAHPAACLILHATSSGSGVHIITSSLPPIEETPRIIPWDNAQSTAIPQSLTLANELGAALLHAKLPVLLTHASVRPLDNLTCPAVAIEIAPLTNPGSDPTPVTNSTYQQHVADAIAAALTSWRTQTTGAAR